MNAIQARGLVKWFGLRDVLHWLDLSIPTGSVYGLLGRNGAGKTTLLKLAVGLLVPDEGTITVLGHSLVDGGQAEKAPVGYVPDHSLLPVWMRLEKLLAFEARLHPEFDPGALRTSLGLRRILPERKIGTLSKGQLRSLDIAIALAGRPSVLILDEPFDGLDPVARSEAMESLIDHVARTGCTVLISSHVLTDLERLCDRIGVLAGGHIAFESGLDALKESAALVFGSPSTGNLELLRGCRTLGASASGGRSRWLVTDLAPEAGRILEAHGLEVVRPGLEELGRELIAFLDPEVPALEHVA